MYFAVQHSNYSLFVGTVFYFIDLAQKLLGITIDGVKIGSL
jgi:hypothetical protein